MSHGKIWVVRAGRGARYVEEFLEDGVVAIGWPAVGAIDPDMKKPALIAKLAEAYPAKKEGTHQFWAGQLLRFYRDLSVGDLVMTYDSTQRLYFLGTIESDVEMREHEDLVRTRRVRWTRQVARDRLSTGTRNSLGAISTLFQVTGSTAKEIEQATIPIGSTEPDSKAESPKVTASGEVGMLDEIVSKSEEFIEDRIARLDWQQLQLLVAGVLEAMGYRSKVAERGPDRGIDIFASPDGLGLQEPRIFVEVKHRTSTPIGAQQIRSFLGGRQPGDRCLYVSTGGFSKEARYEAERSSVPLTLITLPDLRALVVDHYDKLDAVTRSMVPLQVVYWPVG
jgi:restriction system protein